MATSQNLGVWILEQSDRFLKATRRRVGKLGGKHGSPAWPLVGARRGQGDVGLFEWLLAAQLATSGERRFDDVLVTRTATKIPVQAAPHLGFRRVGMVAQELIDGDNHAG